MPHVSGQYRDPRSRPAALLAIAVLVLLLGVVPGADRLTLELAAQPGQPGDARPADDDGFSDKAAYMAAEFVLAGLGSDIDQAITFVRAPFLLNGSIVDGTAELRQWFERIVQNAFYWGELDLPDSIGDLETRVQPFSLGAVWADEDAATWLSKHLSSTDDFLVTVLLERSDIDLPIASQVTLLIDRTGDELVIVGLIE